MSRVRDDAHFAVRAINVFSSTEPVLPFRRNLGLSKHVLWIVSISLSCFHSGEYFNGDNFISFGDLGLRGDGGDSPVRDIQIIS